MKWHRVWNFAWRGEPNNYLRMHSSDVPFQYPLMYYIMLLPRGGKFKWKLFDIFCFWSYQTSTSSARKSLLSSVKNNIRNSFSPFMTHKKGKNFCSGKLVRSFYQDRHSSGLWLLRGKNIHCVFHFLLQVYNF